MFTVGPRPYGPPHMTKKLLTAVAALVVAGAAGSAIAVAADDPAPIRACVTKKGALRIATTCKKGETPLTWNAKGPAGAPGAAGPAGAPGPAGPAGRFESNVGGDPLEGGQAEMTAKLDGVADAIAPKSFALNAKNTTSSTGGGGGAGKVEFGNLRFAKLYDASSPKLLLRTATGQHIPSATFTLREDGAVVTYKLSDVVVVDYEQGGDKDRPLLEHVELSFAKVEVSFQPANGAAVTAGWDIRLNKPV
jgi:type VI secretion system secreted protein Hcp